MKIQIDTLKKALSPFFMVMKGDNTIAGNIYPDGRGSRDLGSPTRPFRRVYAEEVVGTPISGTDELVASQAGGTPGYLSDILAVGSGMGISSDSTSVTINIGTHTSDVNAHHNKQHSVTDSAHHTATGSALDIVGLSSTNTLGILTPSSAPSGASVLKSTSGGGLTLTSLTTPSLTAAADITIDPVGNVLFPQAQTINSVGYNGSTFPITGWSIHQLDGSSTRNQMIMSSLVLDELRTKLFIADEVRVSRGEEFITPSFGITSADFTVPGSIGGTVTVHFEDSPAISGAIFTSGDHIVFRVFDDSAGLSIAMWEFTCASYTGGLPDDTQSWVLTLKIGTTGTVIRKSSLALDFGVSGQGYITLNAVDPTGSPYIDIRTWTGTDFLTSTITTNVRIGELINALDADLLPSGWGLYSENAYLKGILKTSNVLIDDTGVVITQAATGTDWSNDGIDRFAFKKAADGVVYGGLFAWHDSGDTSLTVHEVGLRTAELDNWMIVTLEPRATGVGQATISLNASHASNSAGILMSGNSSSSSIRIEADQITITGGDTYFEGNVIPSPSLSKNLGSPSYYWDHIYVGEVHATTISGATSLSGSVWQNDAGNMYITSNNASSRTLYISNNLAGLFHLDVDGNIVVGGTVDGVDVAALSSAYTSHASDPNAHHNQSHVLATNVALGGDHTISGATAGHVLRASSGTAAAFAAIQDADLPATIVRTTVTLTAGSGLTGGGTLAADRTFAVGAGTMIAVGVDDVGITTGSNYQYIGTGSGTAAAWQNVSTLAGNGLVHASGVLAIAVTHTGAVGLTVESDAIRLTSSSNPGATESILASAATTGLLTLARLGVSGVSITAGTYGLSVLASSGADRSVARFGVTSVSDGFTVGYNNVTTNFNYTFDNNATFTISGTVGNVEFDSSGARMSFTRTNANYIIANGAGGYLDFGTNGTSGDLIIDSTGNVTAAGVLTVDGTFQAASNQFFVGDYGSYTLVGINKAVDSQFDLDVAGSIRAGGYFVGKHALQIKDAQMILHFDGPLQNNLFGDSTGHKGQPATEVGTQRYVRGKFGKAMEFSRDTANLMVNGGVENNSTSTFGSDSTVPSGRVISVTTEHVYEGDYAIQVVLGSLGTANMYKTASVTPTASTVYSFSVMCKPLTASSSLSNARVFIGSTAVGVGLTKVIDMGDGWYHIFATDTQPVSPLGSACGVTNLTVSGSYAFDNWCLFQKEEIVAYSTGSAPTSTAVRYAGVQPRWDAGSISLWVRTYGTTISGRQGGLFGIGANADFDGYIESDYSVKFRTNASVLVGATNAVAKGEWAHIAFTWNYSTGSRKIYVDGVLYDSDTSYVPVVSSSDFWVGSIAAGSNYNANGLIDDFVLIDREIDADEVRAIYESNAPVFAETSTFTFRATPEQRIWADSNGLWVKNSAGDEVFGVYNGIAGSYSWAGLTMDVGDVVVGDSSRGGYMLWDDSSAQLSLGRSGTNRITLTSAGVLTINDSGGAAVFTFNGSAGAEFTKPLTMLATTGGIYQGTSGSFDSPGTGIKIWNEAGVGKISGYVSAALKSEWNASDGLVFRPGTSLSQNAGVTWISDTYDEAFGIYSIIDNAALYRNTMHIGHIVGTYTGSTEIKILSDLTSDVSRVKLQADSGTSTGYLVIQSEHGISSTIAMYSQGAMLITGGGITMQGSSVTLNSSTIINENGDAAMDFRVESDTEANMVFLDSSANTLYLGGTTNGIAIEKGGILSFIAGGTGKIKGGTNIPLDTTTGTKIGTATTQKLGFWNATPVVRPGAYTQTAYATASRTQNAITYVAPAAYGAGANGYSTAAMASAVHAAVIALAADLANVKQVVNSLIDDHQSIGLAG